MSSEASVKVVLVNSGRNITWGCGEGVARLKCRSDGIRCISAGMIAPISTCRMKCYKQSSMIPQQRGEAARRCIFTGVSEE
ncbi:hypothetical protein SADUNF_Sadunf17G0033800 [Salix dunnii]|uniref:Uncharacterized protein n=1 Tax=Salix dunnii TaxID=1413687 RepID=A0A835J4U0_9ROSI|nr:hypothetical protein SADUNF_Sadunf17G0033800 [Salix dunnii]